MVFVETIKKELKFPITSDNIDAIVEYLKKHDVSCYNNIVIWYDPDSPSTNSYTNIEGASVHLQWKKKFGEDIVGRVRIHNPRAVQDEIAGEKFWVDKVNEERQQMVSDALDKFVTAASLWYAEKRLEEKKEKEREAVNIMIERKKRWDFSIYIIEDNRYIIEFKRFDEKFRQWLIKSSCVIKVMSNGLNAFACMSDESMEQYNCNKHSKETLIDGWTNGFKRAEREYIESI